MCAQNIFYTVGIMARAGGGGGCEDVGGSETDEASVADSAVQPTHSDGHGDAVTSTPAPILTIMVSALLCGESKFVAVIRNWGDSWQLQKS